MFGWFRKQGDDSAKLDQELANLEREARAASEEAQGHLYNRCGDLCAVAKRERPAVRYYGQAVDAYLGAGYVGPAAAMCRKILRISPAAVRTHCTLACLAAYEGQVEEARRELDRFMEASLRTHTQKLAIARLRLVAGAINDDDLKRHIATHLAALGDTLGAERIEAALRGERGDEDFSDVSQFERVLKAAAADPDELWKFA
jgi:hypothetical protein